MAEEEKEETERRERTWGELALAEQVERMREAVKVLQRRLNQLETQLCGLGGHEHVNGRLMTAYNTYEIMPTPLVLGKEAGERDWF